MLSVYYAGDDEREVGMNQLMLTLSRSRQNVGFSRDQYVNRGSALMDANVCGSL